ncbi:hypothetical protein [Leptolyngbya iicbica]|uniref:Uncharacterized protein n=2 Tax=Cyanophyceae TaxID=3028117 RepID=A0A4Q7EAK9_9CYAN|nr:hypothetical protein [Leptolyngbya sp. LK]RZM79529.1 hypothetical protein DYY88_12475 [Leptolyngbya sp. LK]
MSNSVVVTLTGDASQLNRVLGDVNGKVNSLGSSVGATGGMVGKLLGGLSTVAIGGALAGVTALGAGVAGLASMLPEAASQTNSILASAGAVADGLGVSFDEAREITRGLTGDIARMASELPGATSLYTDLSNQISDTLAKASGGNLETFKDQLKDITDSAGVLSVRAGIDGSEAGSTIDRLLNGGLTISGLRQLRLGEQNPRLVSLLEEALDGSELADLQLEDRVSLLNDVLNDAIPDEALDQMRGSAASALEGIRTSLLDPNVGLFGWLRGLARFEGKNAYELLGVATGKILDLGQSAGDLLNRLGFSGVDPMETVGSFLMTVGRWADSARGFLDNAGLGSLDINPEGLATGLASWVSQMIDNLGVWLASLDWTEAGTRLGGAIVRAMEIFRTFVANLDYTSLLGTAAQAVLGLAKGIYAAMMTITGETVSYLRDSGARGASALGSAITEGFQWIVNKIKEMVQSAIAAIPSPVGVIGAVTGAIGERLTGNNNTGGLGTPDETTPLPRSRDLGPRRETVRSNQPVTVQNVFQVDGQTLYEGATQHTIGAIEDLFSDVQNGQLGLGPA